MKKRTPKLMLLLGVFFGILLFAQLCDGKEAAAKERNSETAEQQEPIIKILHAGPCTLKETENGYIHLFSRFGFFSCVKIISGSDHILHYKKPIQ